MYSGDRILCLSPVLLFALIIGIGYYFMERCVIYYAAKVLIGKGVKEDNFEKKS